MNSSSKNARLIQQFYADCNALAKAVNVQLFESLRDPYWVANEIGGLCDFEYTDFLTPEKWYSFFKPTSPMMSMLNGATPTSSMAKLKAISI